MLILQIFHYVYINKSKNINHVIILCNIEDGTQLYFIKLYYIDLYTNNYVLTSTL